MPDRGFTLSFQIDFVSCGLQLLTFCCLPSQALFLIKFATPVPSPHRLHPWNLPCLPTPKCSPARRPHLPSAYLYTLWWSYRPHRPLEWCLARKAALEANSIELRTTERGQSEQTASIVVYLYCIDIYNPPMDMNHQANIILALFNFVCLADNRPILELRFMK